MRFRDLGWIFAPVPVTSPPLQRQAGSPGRPEAPAPGARWGKPSEFSWSNAANTARKRGSGVTVQYPEPTPRAFMRVIAADLKVMSEVVRVEAPGDPSTWVEVDRMTRMAFQFTEFPPKPKLSSPQPSRTTVYDMEFALHPPEADEYPQT